MSRFDSQFDASTFSTRDPEESVSEIFSGSITAADASFLLNFCSVARATTIAPSPTFAVSDIDPAYLLLLANRTMTNTISSG